MIIKNKAKIENRSEKDILFGITGCEDKVFLVLSHILLLAKQYLSPIRRQNKSSFGVLNSKINTVFLLETMIAKSDNNLQTDNMII